MITIDPGGSKMPDHDTLTDRWIRRLKDNPVVAVALIAAGIVAGAAAFWNVLPDSSHALLQAPFHTSRPIPPNNGWVFAGYVQRDDPIHWANEIRVTVVQPAPASSRPVFYPIRIGDVVQPLQKVPQVIVDYRNNGTLHQLDAPASLTNIIDDTRDTTGRFYLPGDKLKVMDVVASAFAGRDIALWLRVVGSDTDPIRFEEPKADAAVVRSIPGPQDRRAALDASNAATPPRRQYRGEPAMPQRPDLAPHSQSSDTGEYARPPATSEATVWPQAVDAIPDPDREGIGFRNLPCTAQTSRTECNETGAIGPGQQVPMKPHREP